MIVKDDDLPEKEIVVEVSVMITPKRDMQNKLKDGGKIKAARQEEEEKKGDPFYLTVPPAIKKTYSQNEEPDTKPIMLPSQQVDAKDKPTHKVATLPKNSGKGTPQAGKILNMREAKEKKKAQLAQARSKIKNTVPKEGRNIFKDGGLLSDGEIEPFEDHDRYMLKANKKEIGLVWKDKPPLCELSLLRVVETWDSFCKTFENNYWACVEGVPFKWQNNNKVWKHLLVFMASPEK